MSRYKSLFIYVICKYFHPFCRLTFCFFNRVQLTFDEVQFSSFLFYEPCFCVSQMVKNLPAMHESWIQFLGQEDPLEKEVATHSSILPWRISWTGEPGRLQSLWDYKESDMTD